MLSGINDRIRLCPLHSFVDAPTVQVVPMAITYCRGHHKHSWPPVGNFNLDNWIPPTFLPRGSYAPFSQISASAMKMISAELKSSADNPQLEAFSTYPRLASIATMLILLYYKHDLALATATNVHT